VGADAEEAVRQALLTGAGLLASEQLGIAEWCLSTTVAYLKDRTQFARPVGSFQALKHRLADLFAEVEQADAAARYAAATLAADDPDAAVAVAVAASYCAKAATHAAEEAVQLHGGLGMTWEHPAHLHLKRAKADELLLGTPEAHRQALAVLVDLPGPL
jgi:alkylation response protein AidB-like acyl-CoA dehydrogenase